MHDPGLEFPVPVGGVCVPVDKYKLYFSVIVVLASLFGVNEVATIFAISLAVCAGLEAFLNYCVGCKFYAILHHFNIV